MHRYRPPPCCRLKLARLWIRNPHFATLFSLALAFFFVSSRAHKIRLAQSDVHDFTYELRYYHYYYCYYCRFSRAAASSFFRSLFQNTFDSIIVSLFLKIELNWLDFRFVLIFLDPA